MATWSVFFTDTTTPGPQVGDGRPYTAAEWRILYKYLWARGGADRGVLKGVLNECAVTVLGANSLQVDTGLCMCAGGIVVMEAAETLAPASAPGGQTRKDSVICELDLDGSGATEQYTVRAVVKEGTAGAYPTMTQTAVLWQIRLYNYTIDDAGAITGLSDQRQYLRVASEFDHGDLSGLSDDDHGQYYNAARHTKAAHDALNIDADTLDGYDATDFLAAGNIFFKGMMVGWGGAIGGSDGHRPIIDGSPLETWHLANGETVNGVVTLDSRNRVLIGAGDTYAVNAAGGAATVNLEHTHGNGTLAAGNESGHTHGGGTLSTNNAGSHTHALSPAIVTALLAGYHTHTINNNDMETSAQQGTGAVFKYASPSHSHTAAATPAHTHEVLGVTDSTPAHTHSITSGATAAGSAHGHSLSGALANALSSTQSILPPYRGSYFLVYVGT